MTNHCEDCGTKLELDRTCPNCHEELFIATWQAGDLDCPWSEEFSAKVEEQSQIVARNRLLARTNQGLYGK